MGNLIEQTKRPEDKKWSDPIEHDVQPIIGKAFRISENHAYQVERAHGGSFRVFLSIDHKYDPSFPLAVLRADGGTRTHFDFQDDKGVTHRLYQSRGSKHNFSPRIGRSRF